MVIETKRLILRPWNENDANDLYYYCKDERVSKPTGFPAHTSVAASLSIIRNVLSNSSTFAICLKEDNRAIGSIGINTSTKIKTAPSPTEKEVGYWLGVPFWGNGYMTEAVKAIQEYAFNTLNVEGLWSGYFDKNEKSKKVQEKCGFIYHHTDNKVLCPLLNEYRKEHFTYISKKDYISKTNVII